MSEKSGDDDSQKNKLDGNTNLANGVNTQGSEGESNGEALNDDSQGKNTKSAPAPKSLIYVESNSNTQTQAEMTTSIKRIVATPSFVTGKWNKIAIWTEPGTVDGSPQQPTSGWIEVSKESALTWIAGRDDIINEIIGTVWLNTKAFDGAEAATIEDRAKLIVLDLNNLSNTVANTADLAKIYLLPASQISDTSHAMAGAPQTGIFSINELSDKAKAYRAMFKFLEFGIKFPKTDTIKDSAFYGYTDKTLINDLRTKGYSFFSREKTYAWLDSYMIGKKEALFWFVEHYVNEQLQVVLGAGYGIDKTQDAFDDLERKIIAKMDSLVSAKVITDKKDIPHPNETKNNAYMVSMPRAANLEGDTLPIVVVYYRGGRIFRIELIEKLNAV